MKTTGLAQHDCKESNLCNELDGNMALDAHNADFSTAAWSTEMCVLMGPYAVPVSCYEYTDMLTPFLLLLNYVTQMQYVAHTVPPSEQVTSLVQHASQ
jgi:hypothetical protein